jgi:chromosome segregation ATPase
MSTITPASASLVSRLIDSTPTRRVSSRQPSQQQVIFNRRQTLFREIAKLRTKLAKLDTKISSLNEQATLVNDTNNSARERIRYLTQEITRRSQEEMSGNFGNNYARSLRHYNDYSRTNPNDEQGIRSRYTEAIRLLDVITARIGEDIRPLRTEAQSMLRNLTNAQKNYISLNERIHTLTQEKHQLQRDIDTMNNEYLSLTINENVARGKRQRRSTYKKGKKRKH